MGSELEMKKNNTGLCTQTRGGPSTIWRSGYLSTQSQRFIATSQEVYYGRKCSVAGLTPPTKGIRDHVSHLNIETE